MIYKKYLLAEILIILFIMGAAFSCKDKTESSSPYPTVLSVKIMPDNPRTNSKLKIKMEGIEGKDLTFRYLWKRNGEEIFGETFDALSPLNFTKHDAISVVVTPVQGEVVGKSVESDPVVVLNTGPILSFAVIKPYPAYTDGELEVVVEASDNDDDYIVFSYNWIKNGQEIENENSSVLTSENFKRGDSIQCTVIPSDREAEGKTVTTPPIVIANSPPVITSQPPSGVVPEQVFTHKVVADDADEDEMVFSLSSSSPEGMTIDPATGVIKWKIPKDLTGVYPIEIVVSDGSGGRCSQSTNLSIGESTR